MTSKEDLSEFATLRAAVLEEREPTPEAPQLSQPERDALKAALVARFGSAPAASAAPTPKIASLAQVRSQRSRQVLGACTAFLAIAAALFLWFRPASEAPLGDYEIHVTGAAATTRAASSADRREILASGPDVRVEVVVRPEKPVAAPVAAFAYVHRGGAWQSAPGILETSTSGSVRLVATSGAFQGASELKVIVGPARSLTQNAAQKAAAEGARRGLHVFSIDVR